MSGSCRHGRIESRQPVIPNDSDDLCRICAPVGINDGHYSLISLGASALCSTATKNLVIAYDTLRSGGPPCVTVSFQLQIQRPAPPRNPFPSQLTATSNPAPTRHELGSFRRKSPATQSNTPTPTRPQLGSFRKNPPATPSHPSAPTQPQLGSFQLGSFRKIHPPPPPLTEIKTKQSHNLSQFLPPQLTNGFVFSATLPSHLPAGPYIIAA
jgi:hypothetical protein